MAELLEKFRDPVFQAVVGLCLGVAVLVGTIVLSVYIGNWGPLYLGIIVGGFLSLPALFGLTVLFLLWKNPEKHKEREMKERRRAREESQEKND